MNKYNNINFLILALTLLISSGCEEEIIINQSVLGEWKWIKTFYGFTNFTSTPKTSGFKREVSFDDYYYSEFINDSLVEKIQYDLIIKEDTIITNMYLKFENGFEQNISFKGDTLLLFDWMGESSSEYYLRK